MKPAASCTSTRSRRLGRIPCDINAIGADLLTLSAHKIGGPKGVGALIRRDAAVPFPAPLIRGGGQERGARAGTENVAGIAGFGAAAAAALVDLGAEAGDMATLRDRLEAGLRSASPDIVVFGAGGRTAAQHHAVRRSRHEGGDRGHRLRSRGGRRVVGRGLLLGQGPALACARGHGSSARAGPRRGARESRVRPPRNPRSIARSQAWIRISSALPKETRGIAA